ncbi:hypothetical protein GCM10007298_31640 [Williamsia phyllosphaerae]|uniref:Uncharacterized protein n=1 Tax=Williamsia phyllosphaerae TaxID=885042 RepID=A0ABQ1V3J3_9NOCA|nr:hypothetical protein GCM10007298_31640 [Williamsia phyllosphaerae]
MSIAGALSKDGGEYTVTGAAEAGAAPRPMPMAAARPQANARAERRGVNKVNSLRCPDLNWY